LKKILHAELIAIYHGLVLAWGMGIKELPCYSDSTTFIKLIYDPANVWHHYTVIILNIKDLLARDWRVKVVHTLWEGNVCAYFLAKFGVHNLKAFSPIVVPPAAMNLLLLADASGTLFSRFFFPFLFAPYINKKKKN
jgi:hypothetical protein